MFGRRIGGVYRIKCAPFLMFSMHPFVTQILLVCICGANRLKFNLSWIFSVETLRESIYERITDYFECAYFLVNGIKLLYYHIKCTIIICAIMPNPVKCHTHTLLHRYNVARIARFQRVNVEFEFSVSLNSFQSFRTHSL